ncbi:MAG: hypothetical protein AAF739_02040 [Pseudomonadota bacterium]
MSDLLVALLVALAGVLLEQLKHWAQRQSSAHRSASRDLGSVQRHVDVSVSSNRRRLSRVEHLDDLIDRV